MTICARTLSQQVCRCEQQTHKPSTHKSSLSLNICIFGNVTTINCRGQTKQQWTVVRNESTLIFLQRLFKKSYPRTSLAWQPWLPWGSRQSLERDYAAGDASWTTTQLIFLNTQTISKSYQPKPSGHLDSLCVYSEPLTPHVAGSLGKKGPPFLLKYFHLTVMRAQAYPSKKDLCLCDRKLQEH